MPSLSLLLLGSFICFGTGCGACPTSADSMLGVLPVLLYYPLFANVFINFSAFCLFYLYFYSVSLPKVSPGGFCAYGTHDVTSDWVSLGPLLSHPGLCYLPDVYVYTAAPVASSDRLRVAVALSSSL